METTISFRVSGLGETNMEKHIYGSRLDILYRQEP